VNSNGTLNFTMTDSKFRKSLLWCSSYYVHHRLSNVML